MIEAWFRRVCLNSKQISNKEIFWRMFHGGLRFLINIINRHYVNLKNVLWFFASVRPSIPCNKRWILVCYMYFTFEPQRCTVVHVKLYILGYIYKKLFLDQGKQTPASVDLHSLSIAMNTTRIKWVHYQSRMQYDHWH